MSNHGQTVKTFWEQMNRHNNAKYKKFDNCTVIELERHKTLRASEQGNARGRLVMWVETETGWEKAASTWGSYSDVSQIYKGLKGVSGPGTESRRRHATEVIKTFES